MSKELVERMDTPVGVPNEKPDFKGYTLEELRYQRAMVLLRRDFCKARILNQLDRLRGGGRDKEEKALKSRFSRMGGVLTKVMSGLNYVDYALMGMSLFGTGKKVYKFFRRK